MFSWQDRQGGEVEDSFVIVGVGQGSAHLGGQGFAAATFELRRCVGRTVDEEFESTYASFKSRLRLICNTLTIIQYHF
jgi:hypothetical protein